MSYPIDTIRRRMMMTSGGGAKYKGSIDCGMQILKNEGFMSMMMGAGANVLRGVAGAGVPLALTSSRPCTSPGEPASKSHRISPVHNNQTNFIIVDNLILLDTSSFYSKMVMGANIQPHQTLTEMFKNKCN